MIAILSYILFAGISSIQASCANSCSGHGECSGMNCDCEDGWDLVQDCSQKDCPYDLAWSDKAYDDNLGHTSAECSGRGKCERSTGTCQCLEGFTGAACQRLTCDSLCSGRGTCMSLLQVSEYYSDISYSVWDSDMTSMCICDWGYTGSDCSLRLCARGDDPLTTSQDYREIVLTTAITTSGNNLDGTFKLTFMDEEITFEANAEDFSSANCETFFESFEAIDAVSCSRSSLSTFANTAVYTISIEEWSSSVRESNVFYHDGNPSISEFECEIDEMTGTESVGVCTLTDSITSNLVEYSYCGNRGICDFSSGICDCFAGFSGPACYDHEDYFTDADSNVMLLYATSNEYEGNILMMQTDSGLSSDYSFMYVEANGLEVLELTGNGLLQLSVNGIHVVEGGMSIDDGGLVLQTDGLTIHDDGISVTGGVSIRSDGLMIEAGGVSILEGGIEITDGTVSISAPSSTSIPLLTISLPKSFSSTGLLIDAPQFGDFLLFDTQLTRSHNESVFSVSNDPLTTISRGGLLVAGGISISSGGLDISAGGITVDAGGLYVQAGGMSVNGGLSVTSGVTISNSGLVVLNGDVTISAGGLNVYDETTLTGKLTANGGIDYSGSLTALSDLRMKKDVVGYRHPELMEAIMKLRPVKFKWKSSNSEEIGFIAQEVLDIMPDLVHVDSETDLLSIIQSRFIPIFVQSMQDMRREYEAKLQELEQRILLLESKI